ncbi:RluA family pseudouridine synthase [Campylobacter sp. JMF_04 NA10]|uniref:RluA family pseudouridine synthase n=1 Tax=Campylobacter sp. JMF_04 NA10 TaxID=2983824 RepID=UPI0022EA0A13|nr:RluA family pseudouridine synthase [Campylobacter sp. JMF_04 NA10]
MAYEKFSLGKFAGRRIFEILLGLGYDMKGAQRLCDKGRVLDFNGVVLAKNSVANGEIFLIDYKCEPKGARAIFETDEFAVFDKPSGVLSHPNGRHCKYSLYDEIWATYGRSAAVVHRLDKETSGVILVAKNLASLNALKMLFENRAVKKSYFALVSGRVERDFVIDEPIGESLETDEVAIKMRICENGKKAITEIYPIEYFSEFNATLVRAVPLTGRQHQIRLHLFHVKHKILGDPLYGTDTATFEAILDEKLSVCEWINLTGASRLCLHAANLSFDFNGQIYDIQTKADFKSEFLKALKF